MRAGVSHLMPNEVDRKLRVAASLFAVALVICVLLGVFAIERLVSGDGVMAVVLGSACALGLVWTAYSRYSNEGVYNPSRIHRLSKTR